MKIIIESLKSIGFSNLEAQIYITLLKEGKSTGYKIAKLIGKPVSNIYKTLITLQKKGLILIDETKNPKECTPIPIKEYFKEYEDSYSKSKELIENQLKTFSIEPPNEGIYQIDSVDQVIKRGKDLINGAKKVVMANLFPFPLSVFKNSLERKAAEGVKVMAKIYEPIQLKGCHVVEHTFAHEFNLRKKPIDWKSDWCNIIIDDEEFLIAFFEKNGNGVLQAIWSKSTYLNLILFSGFANKFILSKITKSIYSEKSVEEIRSELTNYYREYMYGFPSIDDFTKLIKQDLDKIKNEDNKN